VIRLTDMPAIGAMSSAWLATFGDTPPLVQSATTISTSPMPSRNPKSRDAVSPEMLSGCVKSRSPAQTRTRSAGRDTQPHRSQPKNSCMKVVGHRQHQHRRNVNSEM